MKAGIPYHFLCKLSFKITYTVSFKVALLQSYGHFVASLSSWSCAFALPRPGCLEWNSLGVSLILQLSQLFTED